MGLERGLILAGSAAGVAAAFNTPLAGIVFAIEEMSRAFEQRTSGLVLIAVIFAGLASLGVLGNYSYFGTTSAVLHGWHRLGRRASSAAWPAGSAAAASPRPWYGGPTASALSSRPAPCAAR